jgi:hypothetical protein
MVAQGFNTVGYNSIHMDDCWEQKIPPRDPTTGKLRGDPIRFPSGMKALGDYYKSKGIKYALYTAESPTTCGGYPASAGHELLDAKTFAEWGVGGPFVSTFVSRVYDASVKVAYSLDGVCVRACVRASSVPVCFVEQVLECAHVYVQKSKSLCLCACVCVLVFVFVCA